MTAPTRPSTDLDGLREHYDLIVVGGGITGAGVLREAVRGGARCLLVEARDFASGTSSRSSKLVHGGLRYLKTGQWHLTLESVRERQRLLNEAPGLIRRMLFAMPIHAGQKPGRWVIRIGLALYDLMALTWRRHWRRAADVQREIPALRTTGLRGALVFEDATTDDARLVQRLLFDARAGGADLANYTEAQLCFDGQRVTGVRLRDMFTGQRRDVRAGVVINAGGVWAASIPGLADAAEKHTPKLRPLRGSHLVFSVERFALPYAVSWMHPRDHRPVFAYPWEGAVICGTTDLDHHAPLEAPRIDTSELDYLLEALAFQFPQLGLTSRDVISTYAGVRPVVDSGKDNPSDESRESALWSAPGIVSVTGGKLTTFRVTARQVLAEAARQQPALKPGPHAPVFASPDKAGGDRLVGRYGAEAAVRIRSEFSDEASESVGATVYCWGELRWAARHEQVRYLSDLMLRRTRLGLVALQGGEALLPRILEICRDELGWDESRCAQERQRYLTEWRRDYGPPVADRT